MSHSVSGKLDQIGNFFTGRYPVGTTTTPLSNDTASDDNKTGKGEKKIIKPALFRNGEESDI